MFRRLQRIIFSAGRAGRRKEAASVALTFCKSLPHDRRVFVNPKWPFDTKIRVPVVSLESEIIVQRHINSLIFSEFTVNVIESSSLVFKLARDLFVNPDQAQVSRFDEFMQWIDGYPWSDSTNKLVTSISKLTIGSILVGSSPKLLASNAATHPYPH